MENLRTGGTLDLLKTAITGYGLPVTVRDAGGLTASRKRFYRLQPGAL